MRHGAALALIALFALSVGAHADEIVVDQGGAGDFTTIKEAFAAAADGDTITINPGTYTGEMNRDIDWGARNLFLQPGMPRRSPVIDLEGAHRFITLESDYTDTTSIITGLDIINGAAPDVPSGGGGAILAYHASPKIIQCNFSGCTGEHGGAVKFLYSNGRILHCSFRENTAGWGGGLSVGYGEDAVIEGCVFYDNSADRGGAMRFFSAVESVRGCTIAWNASPAGAGIVLDGGASPAVSQCIIAFSTEGPAMGGTPPDTVFQCISYGNAGGDDLSGSRQDVLYVDPLFCGVTAGILTMCENSPALAPNNPWGVRVGVFEQGCAPCDSPVTDSTWGRIKALYRP